MALTAQAETRDSSDHSAVGATLPSPETETAQPVGDEGLAARYWRLAKKRVSDVWEHGEPTLIIPLHTHHLRHFYTAEKIATYQENPYGLGLAKVLEDNAGNTGTLFAIILQDSHFKPEYAIGYEWQKRWQLGNNWRAGLGYIAGVTARSDIGHYFPLPGVLPVASVGSQRLSVNMLYLPGGRGNGNILFFWGKWVW